MLKSTALSCKENKFKDRNTGKERTYFSVYIAAPDGAVGYVYADRAFKAGDPVNLELAVNKDGKFTVRVTE